MTPFVSAVPTWVPIVGGGALLLLAAGILLLRHLLRPTVTADLTDLDDLLQASGFAYDEAQDIFYSRHDAWQRDFGYRRLYDEAAAPLGMLIDCEPVYFEYDDRRWLIELWKGQYGMCCGAEIGVYAAPLSDTPPENTHYQSISDAEQLRLAFRLKQDKRTLLTRQDRHWWLTGFRLGEYCHPEELTLYAQLTLPNAAMRRTFTDALRALGYDGDALYTRRQTVFVRMERPHSKQPASRATYAAAAAMRRNERLCALYRAAAVGIEKTPNRLRHLRETQPALYRAAMQSVRPSPLYRGGTNG